MFHYTVKVPSSGEILTAKETIIDRLDYFNDCNHYLLFNGGNEAEKRFIMVSEKKATKALLTELKEVFETPVFAEEINVRTVDHKMLKKIHAAKNLMLDRHGYRGDQKTLLITDTATQLIEKVDAMIGFTKYKAFYRRLADYIDRTIEMRARCTYNVVLINKCGICLDAHIELLYGLFSAKGLLIDHVMITGAMYEAENNRKETKCVYFIDDSWEFEDDGVSLKASDEVKLLRKIRKSHNIYITAMTQEQYDKISVLDIFTATFPNMATVDELTTDEKLQYVCSVADEYGFTVNKDGFGSSQFILSSSIEKIETSVRQAVFSKLAANDSEFCLHISDIDVKTKKIKKVSAFTELESLVGLSGVKNTVREIVTFLKKRGKKSVPCLHMAFLGNPGVGKTTVARILARIFFEAGIIKKNLLVETDRGGLIGLYVGHTADKTSRKIESALGGILFVDEAYSLFSESRIDYGHEAVATLVKAMEDKRDEFVCILAGYTNEMNAMLDMNPGLRDRVQFYVDFPDYIEIELLQIFEKLCKDNKYKLSQSAIDTLTGGFSRFVGAKSQNFSNGRLVRKLFERARMKQALRTSSNVITDLDIEAVLVEKDIATLFKGKNHAQIGFKS